MRLTQCGAHGSCHLGCGGSCVEQRAGLGSRREAAVGQQKSVRKSFPVRENPGAPGGREKLEPWLSHQADPVGLGDTRHSIGGGWIVLAVVVKGAMWLHVRDGHYRGETGHLKRDERLDLVR